MRDESLGRLRSTALMVMAAGAVGSLGFLLYSGRNSPRLLMVVMSAWVLAPFIALVLADAMSTRWPVLTSKVLYIVVLAVTLCSLAAYLDDLVRPHNRPAAAVFVIVPGASWAVIAIAVPLAALASRRRSHGG
jgi:hypothetical protein